MGSDWLTAAEARLAKATPGPWYEEHCQVNSRVRQEGTDNFIMEAPKIGGVRHRADAAFIAAAPTDLRRALAVCRAAERVAADLEALSPQSPWVAAYAVELRAALTGEEI